MIRKLIIIAALLTFSPVVAHAQYADEPSMPNDRRIKLLTYDDADIYTIQTMYGFQTHIVFDSHEEIHTISVGDRSPWQIVPNGARLFIRPLLRNVITNMTVLTNKRAYQFEIKSAGEGKEPLGGRESDVIFVAKFLYPDKEKLPVPTASFDAPGTMLTGNVPFALAPTLPPASAPVRAPAHSGFASPQNPNYSYTFSGPDELAPIQVYDNGSSTYIKYRDNSRPVPAIFALDANGRESQLLSRREGDYLVVDAVAGQLSLKSGNGTVNVYNEVLNPN